MDWGFKTQDNQGRTRHTWNQIKHNQHEGETGSQGTQSLTPILEACSATLIQLTSASFLYVSHCRAISTTLFFQSVKKKKVNQLLFIIFKLQSNKPSFASIIWILNSFKTSKTLKPRLLWIMFVMGRLCTVLP